MKGKGIAGIIGGIIIALLFKVAQTETKEKDELYLPTLAKQKDIFLPDTSSIECSLNTYGIAKANGVKMKVYYPCSWTTNATTDTLPGSIIQLCSIKDDISLILSVSVIGYDFNFTTANINKISAADHYKKQGTYINSKKISFYGIPGDEVITYKKDKKATVLSLVKILYYENNLIALTYSLISPDNDHASNGFENYKYFFQKMFNRTEIL